MFRLITDQGRGVRILRHLLLFFGMVLLFSWVAHSRSGEANSYLGNFLIVLINALFFFGYAYLTVYLMIPFFLIRKRVLIFIILFILSGLALSLLKFLFSDYIFYHAFTPENGSIPDVVTLKAVLVNTKDMTFIVAVFAIAKYARDHYIVESNIRELKQKGMEAEIKLLEHQMDPHVIFNNFNSLYSISLYRPDRLKETAKQLRSNLHYLFRKSKHESVPLSDEINMIENYIGLEKLRFGDRLNITYRMEGDPGNLKIAPLILYPFVENCFVHGAGEDPHHSWIRIEIAISDGNLRFCAANSVSGFENRERSQVGNNGNKNRIRRLEIQYPNSHRLAIFDRLREHIVELNLRLRT